MRNQADVLAEAINAIASEVSWLIRASGEHIRANILNEKLAGLESEFNQIAARRFMVGTPINPIEVTANATA